MPNIANSIEMYGSAHNSSVAMVTIYLNGAYKGGIYDRNTSSKGPSAFEAGLPFVETFPAIAQIKGRPKHRYPVGGRAERTGDRGV